MCCFTSYQQNTGLQCHRVLTPPSFFLKIILREFHPMYFDPVQPCSSPESSQIFPPSVSDFGRRGCEWSLTVVLLCFLRVNDTASLLVCLLFICVSGWGCLCRHLCSLAYLYVVYAHGHMLVPRRKEAQGWYPESSLIAPHFIY